MRKPSFDKGQLTEEWNKTSKKITGYHIHIYASDSTQSPIVQNLADQLRTLFDVDTGGPWNIGKIGPHTKDNIEIDIKNPEAFGKVVAWLQMNNKEGLSILVHPRTGDELADHTNGVWIGKPVSFDDHFFIRLRAEKAQAGKSPGR